MNCLLVAATPIEISPFLHYLQSLNGNKKGLLNDTDVLITGIGLTAATYSIAKRLHISKPGLVIQAGVAGCFSKKIPLGAVMAVQQDCIADQSVVELNTLKTLFNLKLVPQNMFPFKKGWLVNPDKALLKSTGLKTVQGISVNEITTSKQKIRFYEETFNPVVESMEGAALHYTCLMEKVPFLQLRSTSNYIGERNKKNWDMKTAVTNLNNQLITLFNTL
jgi:futalosine hydrolase